MLAILAGSFQIVLIFSLLLFVHELGHFLTAHFLGWQVDKIVFYPYGGASYFNEDINKPLIEELLILLFGPLCQMLFFIILNMLPLSIKTLEIVSQYNYAILFFNLLPIYPLDGGKLVNILFSFKISYHHSLWCTLIVSFLSVFSLIMFLLPRYRTINFICLITLLLTKLLQEYKKREYYYQKFLLERYLNNYSFPKFKIIHNTKQMMRDHMHTIKQNGHYYTEKFILAKKYEKKN